MTRVYKYEMKECNEVDIRLPIGARILSIQAQQDSLCCWALVDPKAKTEMRHFRIFGTGHDIPSIDGLTFVATVQMAGGYLVWHIFEKCATGPDERILELGLGEALLK